jgi:hypothetical protein
MSRVKGVLSLLLLPLLTPVAVLAQTQSEQVRLLGEVRVRGEFERPASTDTADAFTLLRSRLGIEARLSPRALVFLQLQDSRTFGEESSTTDASADRFDLHQGYLQYGSHSGEWAWSARVGRQEIALGNERLIGAVGWSNTGRSFDAARVSVGPVHRGSARRTPMRGRARGAPTAAPAVTPSWSVTAVAANIQERGRRLTGTAPDDSDHLLFGAFLDAAPIEAFVFHDASAQYRQFADVDRTTIGARVTTTAPYGVAASLEGSWQLGSQLNTTTAGPAPVAQDIEAYLLGARLGYQTSISTLRRVGLGVDLLSGDDEPGSDTYRAFNTMYATNHRFYGYMDLFLDPAARTRDRGLIDAIASLTLGLPRAPVVEVDAHGFWLHRSLPTSADRLIGWELDLTIPVRLGPGQLLHLGYSAFRNGPAAPLIGLGAERDMWHWAYLQASFAFGGAAPPILQEDE